MVILHFFSKAIVLSGPEKKNSGAITVLLLLLRQCLNHCVRFRFQRTKNLSKKPSKDKKI